MYRRLIVFMAILMLISSGCLHDAGCETVTDRIIAWQMREPAAIVETSEYRDLNLWDIEMILVDIAMQFDFVNDKEKWGVEAYWQTSEETSRDMSGDCEDYAILVYITLLNEGYSPDMLGMIIFDITMESGEVLSHCCPCIFPGGHMADDFYAIEESVILPSVMLANYRPTIGFTIDSFWIY